MVEDAEVHEKPEREIVWYKRPGTWIAAIVTAVVGVVFFIFSLGGRRVKALKPPPAPVTEDIEIPNRIELDTEPLEKFDVERIKEVADVSASINSRFE